MNKKSIALLLLIIILASILRLWQLGEVPPSPDWDEAALGYNAYSIMTTGRDEYGKFLPIILRSFDDYKPAFYAYLVIPFIKLFGLNVWAVRLPSAVFGILTVITTYFLVKELFILNSKSEIRNPKQYQNSNDQNFKHQRLFFYLPFLSSFLLAISPWHIQFSRVAFESNVGMGLNAITILLFLKSLKKPWLLLVTALVMGLNLYMYQSEKVFIPLLTIALVVIFRKDVLMLSKRYIAWSILILAIMSLPLVHFVLTNKEVFARAKGVSIFSDLTPLLHENAKKLIEDRQNKDYLGLILDNRRVEFFKSIISGYISHFDLNWLFITGDIARHHAPNMGLLYLWELPFLLTGIYGLIFGNFDKRIKMFIIAWFLIVPIPASITSGVPHAVRTLNFLPIFQIFTAMGILTAVGFVSSIRVGGLFAICYLLFAIFNFSYYLNQYFVQQNYFNSVDWQYGYKQAILEIQNIESKYKKIVVSNKPYLDQSYMFFLFYLKYPPSAYQNEEKSSSGGFRENHKFGKFEFRPIVWDIEEKNSNVLYVGTPSDFQAFSKVIKSINFINGTPAILIVEGR